MATKAEESTPATRPPANLVGNAFVEQYYNMLCESPENVHKFYQNSSVMSRLDSDGIMQQVSTLDGIDEMILSIDYKGYVVEILTTDSQQSFGDGVIVFVTGFFTGKDNIRRKFAQVFFLEPQQHGHSYYVLNDVLRYVGEEEVVPIKINDAYDPTLTAPATSDPEPIVVSPLHENTTPPVEEETVQDTESTQPLNDENISTVHEEIVSSRSVDTIQNDGNPVSEQSEALSITDVAASTVQDDAPKKSYASVANALNFKKQPFQQKALPAKPVKKFQAPVIAIMAPEVLAPLPNDKTVEKDSGPDVAVKGYSIFVANLPMNATVEQLKETFERFGPIKPNGIQVRSYKLEKNCFGFVEFESASSMQSALEVSSIEIGGRQAHIEEKKANNEGSKFPPRKTGFRGDNFWNRGNSRGRGYGRNESDNQGGQPRGTSRRNGEANQKGYQNGGGRGASRQAQGQGQGEGQVQAEGGKS